jgi:hypothetical protein
MKMKSIVPSVSYAIPLIWNRMTYIKGKVENHLIGTG